MEARRILVAGSGGIAAYKLPEVVRALVQAGHDVRCALTPEATRFVSPLVLQTLTQSPVRHALFDPSEESQIDHISLADWAELVVVAPATANVLAKLAHGLADDLVTAVLLATRARILVAPAMNVNMWEHPATRENVERLRGRGVAFAGPEAGELACGWVGQGRMVEPLDIAAAAELELGAESLAGARVVVTAAGTREAIDDVLVDYKPNLLANYLFGLAQTFSVFFDRCPVLKAEPATRHSRLLLADLVARQLKRGLGLLGIVAPDSM